MTELEEKKKVSTWLGYPQYEEGIVIIEQDHPQVIRALITWNPQSDKLATCFEWKEIYSNMNEEEKKKFGALIYATFPWSGVITGHSYELFFMFVDPSIRWKKLLEVIS